MDLRKYIVLLFICAKSAIVFAQNGQDVEHLKPLSIEDILMKENPNKARALFKKEKFLVLENLRSGKRKRFYVGDIFRCKTKDGLLFEEEIQAITDSSYVTSIYNEVFTRFEYHEVMLKDITRVYRKPANTKFKFGFAFAPLAYILVDWAAYGISPLNSKSWGVIAALEVGNLAIQNAGMVFKSKKITDVYRIKVFQNY